MIEPLIDIKEVAARMNVSVRHVNTLKAQGLIPFIKLSSKCVRYRWSDVEKALEELTYNPNASHRSPKR
ncbi:hypothetical protein DB345_12350 [Spartobacteria bacterium LR76]|nr:hypothetical protein DB345_12350 [Spartobacteria bacterium LR76]